MKKWWMSLEKYSCPVILMASNNIPGDPVGMNAIMESLERIISRCAK